jgi:hypothetical protein
MLPPPTPITTLAYLLAIACPPGVFNPALEKTPSRLKPNMFGPCSGYDVDRIFMYKSEFTS